MCGCFGNMCTCIYCVLYRFFYVYLFVFVTSVRPIATEWKLNLVNTTTTTTTTTNNNNNNNNNNFVEEIVVTTKNMYMIMCLEYFKASERACCGLSKQTPNILPINVCSKHKVFYFPPWPISAGLKLLSTVCQRFVQRRLSGSFNAWCPEVEKQRSCNKL
jgi:hypothetical protein